MQRSLGLRFQFTTVIRDRVSLILHRGGQPLDTKNFIVHFLGSMAGNPSQHFHSNMHEKGVADCNEHGSNVRFVKSSDQMLLLQFKRFLLVQIQSKIRKKKP